jgi:histidine triad (HIT) family protein
MDTCIFCDIIAGKAPASIIYDDDKAVALLTLEPINQGHLLVIPRTHAPYLADLDEATGAHLFVVGMRMAAALRRSDLRCEGINFFFADGAAAFQEVFHAHLHVFPRFVGDPFKIDANWETHPSRDDLDAVAAQIRQVL